MRLEARRARMMGDPEWPNPILISATKHSAPQSPPRIPAAPSPSQVLLYEGESHNEESTFSQSPTRTTPVLQAMEESISRVILDNDAPMPLPITTSGWTFNALLSKGKRFKPVPRVSATASPETLEQAVVEFERSGVPLLIENWHKRPEWPKDTFSLEWLLENHRNDIFPVRNVHDRSDKNITLSDFVNHSRAMPTCAIAGERERLYGKDAECPSVWKEWLDSNVLPSGLLPNGPNNLLQHSEEIEHLMCYLGIGDTFTPCHKDLCASTGQNIMCCTENDGCSYWFMTASSAAPDVATYFNKTLDQELDWESHVATVDQFAHAPFDVYIVEQKLGDLVLVPPRSCHQVVNFGGLTVKMSWSRMTVAGLGTALRHELPIYRRVCRAEKYKVRATIYRSVLYLAKKLEEALENSSLPSSQEPLPSRVARQSYGNGLVSFSSSTFSQLSTSHSPSPLVTPSVLHACGIQDSADKLGALIALLDEILSEEYTTSHADLHMVSSSVGAGLSISQGRGMRSEDEEEEDVDGFVCDFCGADIFQSCFECKECDHDSECDAADSRLMICATCYVEGRTCSCERMRPVQCRPLETLLAGRNKAVEVLTRGSTAEIWAGDWGYDELTDSTVVREEDLPVFEAALILHDRRITAQAKGASDRNCKASLKGHPVSAVGALTCTPCHGARCFAHLLGRGVHCAEALLADKKQDLHELHKDGKVRFEKVLPALREAEKTGSFSKLQDRLVRAAKECDKIQPLNSKFTKPGWYDHSGDDPELELFTDPDTASQHGQRNLSVEVDPAPSVTMEFFSSSSPLTDLDELSDEQPSVALSAHLPKRAFTSSSSTVTSRPSRHSDAAEEDQPPARSTHELPTTRSRRQSFVGVLMPLVPTSRSKKRPSPSLATAPRKKAKAAVEGTNRGSDCLPRVNKSLQPLADGEESDYVNEDYAPDLAHAFRIAHAANSGQCILSTRQPRDPGASRRRTTRHLRRIDSPESLVLAELAPAFPVASTIVGVPSMNNTLRQPTKESAPKPFSAMPPWSEMKVTSDDTGDRTSDVQGAVTGSSTQLKIGPPPRKARSTYPRRRPTEDIASTSSVALETKDNEDTEKLSTGQGKAGPSGFSADATRPIGQKKSFVTAYVGDNDALFARRRNGSPGVRPRDYQKRPGGMKSRDQTRNVEANHSIALTQTRPETKVDKAGTESKASDLLPSDTDDEPLRKRMKRNREGKQKVIQVPILVDLEENEAIASSQAMELQHTMSMAKIREELKATQESLDAATKKLSTMQKGMAAMQAKFEKAASLMHDKIRDQSAQLQNEIAAMQAKFDKVESLMQDKIRDQLAQLQKLSTVQDEIAAMQAKFDKTESLMQDKIRDQSAQIQKLREQMQGMKAYSTAEVQEILKSSFSAAQSAMLQSLVDSFAQVSKQKIISETNAHDATEHRQGSAHADSLGHTLRDGPEDMQHSQRSSTSSQGGMHDSQHHNRARDRDNYFSSTRRGESSKSAHLSISDHHQPRTCLSHSPSDRRKRSEQSGYEGPQAYLQPSREWHESTDGPPSAETASQSPLSYTSYVPRPGVSADERNLRND